MSRSTDWNVLIQGYLSLMWCQDSIAPENQDKKLSVLLGEFQNKNEGITPLNIGSLLSSAYICFMYPQQTEFENLNFESISADNFSIIYGRDGDAKYRCRRIRNSLAHARFQVSKEMFIFEDQDPRGNDKFKATIKACHFGDFLNNFFHECKNQYFNR
ncbi:HEPN family nuclease [Nitrincola sp. MINF-07-Sa-05]|uniref:HEPN family nuclease n=1 Tax=Nitrincola salilacus TaxID=3400273 RepID=UPI003917F18E